MKKPKTRKPWSQQNIELLTRLYPDTPSKEIAKRLGCSISRIYSKANQLGLKKSEAFLSSPASGRLSGHEGKATRFKPGSTPPNKGIKGYQAGGRNPETQFKSGQRPHNYAPVGSYRIDPHGTLQRKISNAKGGNHKRWRSVHELVWVEANGPIPASHMVVFKPGMKSAELEKITLDVIECISRSEHMKRHSLHNYPESLRLAIQMRGALNRKINHVAKHQ